MATLTAFYDLAVGPVSFDVIPFLVRARMAAQQAGCDQLQIVIVPYETGVAGMFRDKRNLYDEHEMRWRLWHLVVPSCILVRAHVAIATGRKQARTMKADAVWPDGWDGEDLKTKHYLFGPLIEAGRLGEAIPQLSASAHALCKVKAWYLSLGKPVVTLTTRTTYETPRNSDPAQWQALATQLEAAGYAVVWLRDTDVALENGSGFGELNLDLRMACYQLARQNVIGNNGPAMLLWLSAAPFAEFDAAMPFEAWRKFWAVNGLEVGDQLPWAGPDQRLFYEPATADNMTRGLRALGVL